MTTVEVDPIPEVPDTTSQDTDAPGYKEFGDDIKEANAEEQRKIEEQRKAERDKEHEEILKAVNDNMNRLGTAMHNTMVEIMTGVDPTKKNKEGDD